MRPGRAHSGSLEGPRGKEDEQEQQTAPQGRHGAGFESRTNRKAVFRTNCACWRRLEEDVGRRNTVRKESGGLDGWFVR